MPPPLRNPIVPLLYRSLLRVARTYDSTGPSLTALVYRTSPPGGGGGPPFPPSVPSSGVSAPPSLPRVQQVAHRFNTLLSSYLGGPNAALLPPARALPGGGLCVSSLVRTEFRVGVSCVDDVGVSVELGFMVLKELSNKLKWAERLGVKIVRHGPSTTSDDDTTALSTRREALQVAPLPSDPDPSLNLRSGTFLVAHPMLSGFFSRTVVALVEHDAEGGSYGFIINKPTHFDAELTLHQAFQEGSIPEMMARTFGEKTVRNGGPVNVTLQMLHNVTPSLNADCCLGGKPCPRPTPSSASSSSSSLVSSAPPPPLLLSPPPLLVPDGVHRRKPPERPRRRPVRPRSLLLLLLHARRLDVDARPAS